LWLEKWSDINQVNKRPQGGEMSEHTSTYQRLLEQIESGEGQISPIILDSLLDEGLISEEERNNIGSRLYYLTWPRAQEASTDSLTGLGNRRLFDCELARAFEKILGQRRADAPRAVLLAIADLNYLKWFNDQFGHQIGDKVIKAVARKIRLSLRKGDVVARWGGDEFGIIVLCSSIEIATTIGNRLVNEIKNIPFILESKDIAPNRLIGLKEQQAEIEFQVGTDNICFEIKVAAGYAVLDREKAAHISPEKLIDLADQRMLESKDKIKKK